MSAKEILKEIFESYESMKVICDAAESRIKRGDRRFGEKSGVIPKSKKKDKEKETEAHFDSLYERIEEHYALELISTFEGLVFDRFGDTAGVIRKVVKSGYERECGRIISRPLCIILQAHSSKPRKISAVCQEQAVFWKSR